MDKNNLQMPFSIFIDSYLKDGVARMVKRFSVCIFTLFIAVIVSCDGLLEHPYNSRIYTTAEYSLFWLETIHSGYTKVIDGVTYGMVPPLYPEDINECEVIDYLCQKDEYLPLGDVRQLLLTIEYPDNKTFLAEQDRLKKNYKETTEFFRVDNSISYADRMGDCVWSYALLNTRAFTVTYIYTELASRKNIWFNHEYLPVVFGIDEYDE